MITDNERPPEQKQDVSDAERSSIAIAEIKESSAPPAGLKIESGVNTMPDTTGHTQHAASDLASLTESLQSDMKAVTGVRTVPTVLYQSQHAKPLTAAPRSELMRPSETYDWDDGLQPAVNYRAVGARLAQAGDLYRAPGIDGGLIVAPSDTAAKARLISTAAQLSPLIVDRLAIRRYREERRIGNRIPNSDVAIMLRSEAFLRNFPPLDRVTRTAVYLPDFKLTTPGYHDGGTNLRVLYTGGEPAVKSSTERLDAFLDVMAFSSLLKRGRFAANQLATRRPRRHCPISVLVHTCGRPRG